MRLPVLRSLCGLGVMVLSTTAAAAQGELILVSVDKARVARIPEKTQTLVIGQPGIADVTVLKAGGMGVITGKSFGETNLIALDPQGNLLGEWTVRVVAERNALLVQNGLDRESYICAPQCLPIVDLADARSVAAERALAASAHAGFSGAK